MKCLEIALGEPFLTYACQLQMYVILNVVIAFLMVIKKINIAVKKELNSMTKAFQKV